VLGAFVGVEDGAGEDLGGLGEVFQGVDVDGGGGVGWEFGGFGDELPVWGDDLLYGLGFECSGSSLKVEGGGGGGEEDGGDDYECGGVAPLAFQFLVVDLGGLGDLSWFVVVEVFYFDVVALRLRRPLH